MIRDPDYQEIGNWLNATYTWGNGRFVVWNATYFNDRCEVSFGMKGDNQGSGYYTITIHYSSIWGITDNYIGIGTI